MAQDLLTPWQKHVLRAVAGEPKLGQFYLTGGTALAAYYLEHRLSDDLDFFIFDAPDVMFLQGFMQNLAQKIGAGEVRFRRVYDRNQFFLQHGPEEWRVEFVRYPFMPLAEPTVHEGLRVDSLRDIAANKVMTLLDRFDPKDFVDLYFLLLGRPLEDMRRDAERKFGMKIGALFFGQELMKARRIEVLPKMLKPLSIEELKRFFAQLAKALGPEVLK